MADWRCNKCKSDNRASANFCRMCGEPRPQESPSGSKSALPDQRGASPKIGISSLRDETQGMLAEIRNSTNNMVKAAQSELGIRSSDFSLPDLNLKMPDFSEMIKPSPGFAPTTTHTLEIQAQPFTSLNYALAHCGLPLVPELQIFNNSYEEARDVLIKAWVATDYGEPWQKSLPVLPAHARHVENGIVVPLTKSRLQEVREAEKANLRVDVYTEGKLHVSETYPLEVLAYNEWFYLPGLEALMGCFVQPNSEAIEKIVSAVRDRMRKDFSDTSLDGYQSGDPKKVITMLEALFLTLQKDLQITYINPPPSFERPTELPEGGFSFSQKVFFPEQILKHRRGTCLDLALMCAACVERMGLNPICFLIRGHAFFGAWLLEGNLPMAALTDHSVVTRLIQEGAWLPMNSTTFAVGTKTKFEDCLKEGLYCASNPETFMCAIDVGFSHRTGFKPLPPIVGA